MTRLPADGEPALGARARMLPVWQAHPRIADAFWPRLDALYAQLLARAPDGLVRATVRARVDALLGPDEGPSRPAHAERGGRLDRPVVVSAAEVPDIRDLSGQNR